MPGPTPERDTTRRLAALEQRLRQLERQLAGRRDASLLPRPLVRLGITYTDNPDSYPDEPATIFPVMFLDATFTPTPGNGAVTWENHAADYQVAAANWTGEYLRRGTRVFVLEERGRHYIAGVEQLDECDPDSQSQCCFTFRIDPELIPGFDRTKHQALTHIGGCWLWKNIAPCPTDDDDGGGGGGGGCSGEATYYWNGAAWEAMGDTCSEGCSPTPPEADGTVEGEIGQGSCE